MRGSDRLLTAAQFQQLAEVPPEVEWFANIENPRTRRAYRIDLHDFMSFVGIATPTEFRTVTRAHVIAWRKVVETRGAAPATIRRKLAALSSLFEHLCEANAVTHNPMKGVKLPDVLPEIDGSWKRKKLRWVVNVREDVNILGRVRPQYDFVQIAMTAHASFRNSPGIWATPR